MPDRVCPCPSSGFSLIRIGYLPDCLPDPATASGSNYDDCAQWLAALLELDSVANQRIVVGWAAAHARLKNLRLAITQEALSVRVVVHLTAGTARFLTLAVSNETRHPSVSLASHPTPEDASSAVPNLCPVVSHRPVFSAGWPVSSPRS